MKYYKWISFTNIESTSSKVLCNIVIEKLISLLLVERQRVRTWVVSSNFDWNFRRCIENKTTRFSIIIGAMSISIEIARFTTYRVLLRWAGHITLASLVCMLFFILWDIWVVNIFIISTFCIIYRIACCKVAWSMLPICILIWRNFGKVFIFFIFIISN